MSQDLPKKTPDWDIDELAVLYNAGRMLSVDMKKKIGMMIPVLVYLQDPLAIERTGPAKDETVTKAEPGDLISQIYVPGELEFLPGPTSSRITVVDYDASTHHLEDPVEWDRDQRCFTIRQGRDKIALTKDHRDLPQFHQVNVWAIVQKIICMYEDSTILGRFTPWGFEGNRILLMPHAGELSNAFYDRKSKSIRFFYFYKNGKRILSCLSHDIIAHETGHAILDGLRPLFIEDSSIQTSAFHEFLADITAVQAAFLSNELRFQAAQESGGDLSHDQIISGIAAEFGFYSDNRPYLRTAQDQRDHNAVKGSLSEYEWSQVLTGAMFDILKEMVAIRMMKQKKNGMWPSLKEAFSFANNRFRRATFQPLDYLTPVDVQFSDYARAVLRADEVVEPRDEDGYRAAMATAFKNRGIDITEHYPTEALHFYAYDIDHLTRSRTDVYHFLNNNRRQLCIPADQDITVVDLYQTDKTVLGLGKLPREIVVQYAWREEIVLKGSEYAHLQGERASLLCGGTLVFDSRGNVISWQHKPGAGKQESGRRMRKYCEMEREIGNARCSQLLAYLRARISAGLVGVQQDDRVGETAALRPVTASRGADGSIHFQVTPPLRHT